MTPPWLRYEMLDDAEKEEYLTRLEGAWEAAGTADDARSRVRRPAIAFFYLLIFGFYGLVAWAVLAKQRVFLWLAACLASALLRWMITESVHLIYKRRIRAYLKILQKKYRCSGAERLTFPAYRPAVRAAQTRGTANTPKANGEVPTRLTPGRGT